MGDVYGDYWGRVRGEGVRWMGRIGGEKWKKRLTVR